MDKMIKYCKMDVVLLEKVFKELSNHIPPKTHYGVAFGGDRGSCPECGSDELIKYNRRIMASGLVKIQYKCKTCNKFHSKTDK
jgi:DNA-directed RNA polymerase subunit RPC12/RpoP